MSHSCGRGGGGCAVSSFNLASNTNFRLFESLCSYEEERTTHRRHFLLGGDPIFSTDNAIDIRRGAGSMRRATCTPDFKLRMASTGELTPLRDIPAGASVYHIHENSTREERNPSANVWENGNLRGYLCWKCNIKYYSKDVGKHKLEKRFPFIDGVECREAETDSDGNQHGFIGDPDHLNDFDWKQLLEKFAVIIDAPMGAGKTAELARLVEYIRRRAEEERRRFRVLVVTYRISLAWQLARRLGLQCYKADENSGDRVGVRNEQRRIDAEIKNDQHDYLVICLNSLAKLGEKPWDCIIFDECGLVRLSFVSNTLTKNGVVSDVWNAYLRLMRNCKHVVLAQDFVSEKDVEFYLAPAGRDWMTRIDVSAFRFKRNRYIHPVTYTNCFAVAVMELQESYVSSFDDSGNCIEPFLVFCTTVPQAKFLIVILHDKIDVMPWSEEVKERNKRRIQVSTGVECQTHVMPIFVRGETTAYHRSISLTPQQGYLE